MVNAATVTAVVVVLGATWWFTWTPPPVVQPDPMSVLTANFENLTGDPVFEGTLEEALNIGLEGASFVNAYSRIAAQRVALGTKACEGRVRPARKRN